MRRLPVLGMGFWSTHTHTHTHTEPHISHLRDLGRYCGEGRTIENIDGAIRIVTELMFWLKD